MKLLYIHPSSKVKKDNCGNLYTDGSYNDEIWNRYLNISKNLRIMLRLDKTIIENNLASDQFNQINNNIKYIEYPNIFGQTSIKYLVKYYFNLKKTIKNEIINSDLVIIRLPGSYLAAKIARKYKVPYVLEVVGNPFWTLWNYNFIGKFIAFTSFCKMKRELRLSKYSIYVTEKYLQKIFPSKGTTANISDVYLREISCSINNRINRYNQEKNKYILGTIGAVNVKYKGHKYVLKAMKFLKKNSNLNFEYYLVGDGSPTKIINYARKLGLQSNVKFFGQIPHTEINQWFDKIDIYIQPSLTEGLPRALIEAMSNGLPCIGTKVGGIPELLDEEHIVRKGPYMSKRISSKLLLLISSNLRNVVLNNINKTKEYKIDFLDRKRDEFYKEILTKIK